jgi:hypothetical protein
LLVIIVVIFWSFAMDWLSYYVPVIHTILHPRPVPLIRDGVVLEGNLKHEAAEFYSQRFPPPAENGRTRELAGEPEVRDLLRAAEKLQEELAWHRERAAAYQRTITEVKRLRGLRASRRSRAKQASEPRAEPGERPA